MGTLLAITNAAAGSASEELIVSAIEILEEHWTVHRAETSSPDDLASALAAHPDVDVVAALGGDGSIHAVVQAMQDAGRLPDTAVALVPFGTGNDFARTLGLDPDPLVAARAVAAGSIRPHDLVLSASGDVTVNAAHIGVGAEAAAKAAPLKKFLGPAAYAVGALSSLFTPSKRARVVIDDRRIEGRVAQVAVGNGRFVGGGGELLPEADPCDGLIDVAVSFSSTIPERIGYVLHLRRGTHASLSEVVYERAREVRVTGERMRCTNDGEITEPQAEHAWTIVPGGMPMLLP